MGSWGYESYSSDVCMDALNCENSRNPKTEEILRALVNESPDGDEISQEVYLGIIVFALSNKCHVPIDHLEKGLEVAKGLLGSKDYLSGFRSRPGKEGRAEFLQREVTLIINAVENYDT